MRKLVVLFVMLLWVIPTITLASPILNNGIYVPIQYNGSGDIYGKYVNSGNLVTIMPGNNEGKHFDFFNDYMETTHGVTLTPIMGFDNVSDCTGIWNAPSAIDFYVVKAGPNFAVYSVDPIDDYGSWSTYDLWAAGDRKSNSLEISHFTGYQASPVPGPATILLLGSGFLGLVSFRRKWK